MVTTVEQNRVTQAQRARRVSSAKRSPLSDEEMLGEGERDDIWHVRMPSSARRYQGLADVEAEVGRAPADVLEMMGMTRESRATSPERQTQVPARRSATQTRVPAAQPVRRKEPVTEGGRLLGAALPLRVQRPHWLVFAGLALLVMILGWVALTAFANWWQVTQDDWHYGRPRTYQTDAVVGHNDSPTNRSHFIALNLNRRIEIVEFPGGDASKARIYMGPLLIGQGQDLTPVTLEFRDVNGDGKPDMIVNVQDGHLVFLNENGAFRPARPGEQINV